MSKKVVLVLLLAMALVLGVASMAFASEAGDVARQYVTDSPTDGMYCSVSANTLRHYANMGDDPYFANGGFMFGTTVGKMKAYVICVDFEDCVGGQRVEYGDLQNVFYTEGMEYDYSKPETYYNTLFAGSAGFGDAFTGSQEYVGMIKYFDQVSYGMMDMEVEFINALIPNEDGSWPWIRMPGEQSNWAIQYASEVEDYRIFGRLYEGALTAAYDLIPDLDIEDISFLYVVTPVNTFGFRSGLQGGAGIDTAFSYQDQAVILRDTELRHEPLLTTKGGVVIGSGTTITKGARGYSGADRGYFRVMAHETSHGLGLIDDYTYSGTDHMSANRRSWGSPVGDWGIMGGMTADVPDWMSWYKFKAGWIADNEIDLVMPGETKEIVVSALGSKEGQYNQGVKMVLIPTEWRTVDTFNNATWNPNGTDYNFLDWFTPVWLGGEEFAMKSFPTGYVLECRRGVGADYLNTTGRAGRAGLLVTQLSNLTWETGHGAAGLKVMRNIGVSQNYACIGQGDYAGVNGASSWEDTSRGVKIEVLESNVFYDRVRVTYTGEGTGVDSTGADVDVTRAYQGVLTLSDSYAVANDTVTVDFDLFTVGKSADNGNLLTAQAPKPVIISDGSPLGVPGGVAGYKMDVTYDADALTYVGNSAQGPFDQIRVVEAGNGKLTVTATGDEMIRDQILSLSFKVKSGAAVGEYDVEATLNDVDLLTFTGDEADFDYVDVDSAVGTVTVNASRTYSISGKITESKQNGTVGVPAEVMLCSSNGLLVAETKSGTYGGYTFENVAPGSYYVVASKHLYDDTRSAAVTVSNKNVEGVDVMLELTHLTITGHVYGDDVSNPLAGAKVQLVDGGFLPVGEPVYTDANGYYEIHDAVVMENLFYTMTAHKEGYGNSNGQNYGISKGDLFSLTEDLDGKDVFLSSTYKITGTITPGDAEANYQAQLFQDGKPVGDPVDATVTVSQGWYGPTTTVTYVLDGVPSGDNYTVQFTGDGYLTRSTTPFKVMTTNVLQKNLGMTKEEGNLVEVTGKVTNEAGNPIANAKVTPAITNMGYVIDPVYTDENGEYTISLPKNSKTTVTVETSYRHSKATADLAVGEEPVTLDVSVKTKSSSHDTTRPGTGNVGGKVEPTQPTVPDEPTSELPFIDVTTGDWFYNDVLVAYKDGLVNGRTATTYVPEGNITVAEAIKLAACMNQLYTDGKVTLTNGEGAAWYSTYVDYCAAKGIIKADEYTDLNAIATRAQFAAIFAAALPEEALPAINNIADGKIPDVKMADSFGAPVYKLYNAGVLIGNDAVGTFAPNTNIKRSEVATILNRMMHKENRKTLDL